MSKGRWETLKTSKKPMAVYVAEPDGEKPKGAVVVIQEAFGVNKQMQSVTDRVADEGYVAVCPDLFYPFGDRISFVYDDFKKALPAVNAITEERFQEDAAHVLRFIEEHYAIGVNKTAALGFCMGGRLSYLSATLFDIACAVSFYGARISEGPLKRTSKITCPLLLFYGGLDKNIPPSEIEKVRNALSSGGVDFEIRIFENADHGYFNEDKPTYDQKASSESWVKIREFLRANL